jgi:hypothetical protein
MPKTNLAITNLEDDVSKLTVDGKQELTIDPRTVGLDSTDEMSILSIAQRESWINSFLWPLNTPQETLLWNAIVDPCLQYTLASGNMEEEKHFPATCFAATPFKFWRGTLRFRFQVVCSNYHKGRLKVVYDPTGTSDNAAEYNTAYTTIVDISDNTDFSIDVGWGQRTTYRQHIPTSFTMAQMMLSSTALTYTTPAAPYGNGTIAVYVVNELVVPNTTINNDIEINVFISALDDFEVASPEFEGVMKLRLNPTPQGAAAAAIEPQAEDVPIDDSIPSNPEQLDMIASKVPITDSTQMVHFGEVITSFRQLLKRYDIHENIARREDTTGIEILRIRRNMFPFYAGYSLTESEVSLLLADGFYVYANMTHLNYVTSAYGGWRGGIRYAIDTTTSSPSPIRVDVARGASGTTPRSDFVTANTGSGQPETQAIYLENYREYTKPANGLLLTNVVNPLINFEVPYYLNLRFSPAKRKNASLTNDPFQPKWAMVMRYQNGATTGRAPIPSYVAAAEDFSCFFYLGPPTFYYSPNVPSS